MWRSSDPIDTYGLCHLTSVAGDALLAIALADSVFFSIPVGEAKLRVAAYLAPHDAAARARGPAARAAPRPRGSAPLDAFAARRRPVARPRDLRGPAVRTRSCSSRSALLILVLSKVHAITKNGLTMAYASSQDGLMRANARLGRIAVAGAVVAAPFGFVFLKIWGGAGPIYLAAAVYAISALLHAAAAAPAQPRRGPPRGRAARRGSPSSPLPAIGAIGLRAASGFLLFLLAFSLREGNAPRTGSRCSRRGRRGRVPRRHGRAARARPLTREEAVVIACVSASCVGALLAFELFGLPLLTVFTCSPGAATEFGRLAFQALMQRHAPPGAQGRVFVRYEVFFQLAWVAGAFIPALLPIDFRVGILILAGFYGVLAGVSVWRGHQRRDARPPATRPGVSFRPRRAWPARRRVREEGSEWRSS